MRFTRSKPAPSDQPSEESVLAKLIDGQQADREYVVMCLGLKLANLGHGSAVYGPETPPALLAAQETVAEVRRWLCARWNVPLAEPDIAQYVVPSGAEQHTP
jgi:hypothetical protein